MSDLVERHRFKGDESDLRMRFNEAIAGGPNMNGDGGWIIHTNGHADDMEEAIARITALRAQLAQARGALEDAKGAIGRLDCTVFGPILSGHAEHLGWVRDQLLDKIIRALSEEGV